MEEEVITVTLTLKPSQKIGDNKWKVTINGDEMITESRRVLYYVDGMFSALSSFKLDEINRACFDKDSLVLSDKIKK